MIHKTDLDGAMPRNYVRSHGPVRWASNEKNGPLAAYSSFRNHWQVAWAESHGVRWDMMATSRNFSNIQKMNADWDKEFNPDMDPSRYQAWLRSQERYRNEAEKPVIERPLGAARSALAVLPERTTSDDVAAEAAEWFSGQGEST